MNLVFEAIAVAAVRSYGESRRIYHLHGIGPENRLRLGNQICSVLGVSMLMKVKRPTWPGFINVRRETFGLYLAHTLALEVAGLLLQATVGRYRSGRLLHPAGLLLWPVLFILVYGRR